MVVKKMQIKEFELDMGKSDWEIGEILGISKNTVHFHVENAKDKFETFSRVQAVTEALLSNSIAI